jgi:hypothetical protein
MSMKQRLQHVVLFGVFDAVFHSVFSEATGEKALFFKMVFVPWTVTIFRGCFIAWSCKVA